MNNLNLTSEEYFGTNHVRIGNDLGLSISYISLAKLFVPRYIFLLKQILLVPQICKNIVSLHKFAFDNDVFFEFHSSYFLSRINAQRSLFITTNLRMVSTDSCIRLHHRQ